MPGRVSSGASSSMPASRTGSSSLNRRVRDRPPERTRYRPLATRVKDASSSVRNSAAIRGTEEVAQLGRVEHRQPLAQPRPLRQVVQGRQVGHRAVHGHAEGQERRHQDGLARRHRGRPVHGLEHPGIGEQPLDGRRIAGQPGRRATGNRRNLGKQPHVRLGEVVGVIGKARVHDPLIPSFGRFPSAKTTLMFRRRAGGPFAAGRRGGRVSAAGGLPGGAFHPVVVGLPSWPGHRSAR